MSKENHPLVRFTRAYFYDDGDGLLEYAPDAVLRLRGNGDDYAVNIVETGGVAAGLMNTGRFPQLDALCRPSRHDIAHTVRRPCCTWQ